MQNKSILLQLSSTGIIKTFISISDILHTYLQYKQDHCEGFPEQNTLKTEMNSWSTCLIDTNKKNKRNKQKTI